MSHETADPDAILASVFVDAHVHIHDCFDLDEFLPAAVANFRRHAGADAPSSQRFMMCLTETCGTTRFHALSDGARPGIRGRAPADGDWVFFRGDDARSLIAVHGKYGELELVAGRQIVTAEKIEVLALGSLKQWDDGLPAAAVVQSVLEAGAIPVLPWGFGKWLGRRRRVIETLIEEFGEGTVYLGDNGGRSTILPIPPEFALARERGMRILPGSDPLPFNSECDRAGSYGFRVDHVPVRDFAWPDLCIMLQRGEGKLTPFGSLESPLRFARNQLAMQYKTRVASRKKAA
jgi:hypothetical protein